MIPKGYTAYVAAQCSTGGQRYLSTQTKPNSKTTILLKVLGGSPSLLTKLPGPPLYYTSLMGDDIVPTQTGKMTFSNFEGDNVVDGFMFNGSVSTVMKKGSIEEWNIYGGEGPGGLDNYHPWHQHNTHFQLQDISYNPNNILGYVGEWRDTVPLYLAVNYTIRFVAPFHNMIMVHCHILKHEDLGMMTLWDVVNAPPTHQLIGEDVVVHDGWTAPLESAAVSEFELPGADVEAEGPAQVSVHMLIFSSVLCTLLGVVGSSLFHRIAFKRAQKLPYEDVEAAQLSPCSASQSD